MIPGIPDKMNLNQDITPMASVPNESEQCSDNASVLTPTSSRATTGEGHTHVTTVRSPSEAGTSSPTRPVTTVYTTVCATVHEAPPSSSNYNANGSASDENDLSSNDNSTSLNTKDSAPSGDRTSSNENETSPNESEQCSENVSLLAPTSSSSSTSDENRHVTTVKSLSEASTSPPIVTQPGTTVYTAVYATVHEALPSSSNNNANGLASDENDLSSNKNSTSLNINDSALSEDEALSNENETSSNEREQCSENASLLTPTSSSVTTGGEGHTHAATVRSLSKASASSTTVTQPGTTVYTAVYVTVHEAPPSSSNNNTNGSVFDENDLSSNENSTSSNTNDSAPCEDGSSSYETETSPNKK